MVILLPHRRGRTRKRRQKKTLEQRFRNAQGKDLVCPGNCTVCPACDST